ncbi:hypothetical protein [Acetivibrio mesophilus]|uniref:Deacetylase sirtuin-type domain-containing protein n=1 Tax=Acetivibrio mesophilus TaxID=2487273 RepID=A0A4Q0I6Z8_9FIRM|nr:hypothetical protein [Acetivibrio mesophilus]ODM25588.1 hypothetical protein A7W90_04755 [Clostridium sp. Bc-iso-3]RXE60174.1 hypothetical protein EFD62_02785 [Acetivibrio mesophilus]HHV29067.1 hypothetical protein [Clostridium sp.]
MNTTLILGAGFSKNSGVPIQSEMPALLTKDRENNDFERGISLVLEGFMRDVFGFEKDIYPELDDLLTCMDISTNSEHHLGIKYSPIHLRALKRLIIYRIFTILEDSFTYSYEVEKLIRFFIGAGLEHTGFLVLNWDTVLEKYISMIDQGIMIDYCNGGKYLTGDRGFKDERGESRRTKIVKIHGSCNWLYCDNCRVLINDTMSKVSTIRKVGIKRSDFELFNEMKGVSDKELLEELPCFICGDAVSAHIATQNYRKSFRANSYPNIWGEAEDMLTNSEKWVFIGYSLPQADYEFKHLLKICELKLRHRKDRRLSIDVVLLNSETATMKYQSFFGNKINRIFNGGIQEYINYLKGT